jgi:hypothetical protein
VGDVKWHPIVFFCGKQVDLFFIGQVILSQSNSLTKADAKLSVVAFPIPNHWKTASASPDGALLCCEFQEMSSRCAISLIEESSIDW